MKQFTIESSNYNYKEELKAFVNSFNELIDKYNSSFDNRRSVLKKINTNIEKKQNSIKKLESLSDNLIKREDELQILKSSTSTDIQELENRKKSLEFTDSEVLKMEKEDIDVLVNTKKSKIVKIDAKLTSTKDKIAENKAAIKLANEELKALESNRKVEEDSLYKTEAILKITESTKDVFNKSILEILKSEYVDVSTREEIAKDVEEVKEPVVGEPFIPVNATIYDSTSNKSDEKPAELTVEEPEEALSILDVDAVKIDASEPEVNDTPKDEDNYTPEIKDLFKKENLDYDSLSDEDKEKLENNALRVVKNMEILKNHEIPLDLTMNQCEIYYNIDSNDLEDLLNIVTMDSYGNGMGFSIDFTYYILNELSRVDVDKLIDVYNNEFMNINSKSGLISLLKLANNDIGDFKVNREENISILKKLGVNTVDAIASEYPDFINMDNPLLLNMLNLFDTSDLVGKLNSDVNVVPKIIDYWKNN